LPDWMICGDDMSGTVFGVMLALAAFILRYIERRYIYAEAETES